jgi:hypothetical protein
MFWRNTVSETERSCAEVDYRSIEGNGINRISQQWQCSGWLIKMGGYICRFCGSDSESTNGFVSLEISTGNRKIIIYVCRECRSHIAGSRITPCSRCGNVWLKKDKMMGGVPHCSLCNTSMPSACRYCHPT